ncbi:MAG TPA: 2-dehydropantoate 2-reductase, partial [Dehalococcoidia bacterium]|nr:2-dehydropantoate 2-reductase [Dehalococcoidia bacterium]
MRVCIVGAGGLGTVLAGFLSRAGAEVTLLVRPAHAAAYEAPRVRVEAPEPFEAPVRLASSSDGVGAFDYLLLCVKGRDTEAALAPLARLDVATALSFQNGMKKNDALLRLFGRKRVIGAATMVGGELLRPGCSRLMSTGATLLGELDGSVAPRAERLAAAFNAAGLPAAAVPQIVTREWQKLVTYLSGALVCALTRTDMAASLLHPELARTRLRLSREVAAIAAAEGHPLGSLPVILNAAAVRPGLAPELPGFDAADGAILGAYAGQGRALRAQGAVVYPSLLQDMAAGRPTELEDTAGDALLRAARHAVPAPALQTCTEL